MLQKLFFFLFLFPSIHSVGQRLQIVPQLGFQYFGMSYISKPDAHPKDFKQSRPEFEATMGIDIKLRSNKLTHVVGLYNPIVGPSFSFKNMFADKGIIPTFLGHAHSSGPNQIFVSYSLENESKKMRKVFGAIRTKYYYSGGIGVGFNKSKKYYEDVLMPWTYGRQIGDNYYTYTVRYRKEGFGVLIPMRTGINLYNKKNRNFLNLNMFWIQGFKKMAEYSIDYEYGYFTHPEYQRSIKDVRLKSRGTVFGATVGMPINILK